VQVEVPDLSSKSCFARPDISISCAHLPDGPFEWRVLSGGAEDVAMPRERLALPGNPTPRERMRALRLQGVSSSSVDRPDDNDGRYIAPALEPAV
jgi:hypothetical protein